MSQYHKKELEQLAVLPIQPIKIKFIDWQGNSMRWLDLTPEAYEKIKQILINMKN